MEDYASTDIREAMSRITQLLDSDASSTHSDPLSDIEPTHTPPPVRHHHPSYSGSKHFDSFNEDVTSLVSLHKELTKTMSSQQFQTTTLNRMSRYVSKTQEKILKLRKDREAKEVQENRQVPMISEKSKKMATQQGSIYERNQKLAEERKKDLTDKKAKAEAAIKALEDAELTFKPKTKEIKTQKKRDAEAVNKALYAWQKEKETKVKTKQELKQKQELDGATFKPELTQRTNKLADRRYKVKKRVDLRLYESTKKHDELLKKNLVKHGPKFAPDLSDTKGHRMRKKLDKDVFNRLYTSTADLAEMLRSYNSNSALTSPKSMTPRAYRQSGEMTSTGSLLRDVMPGSKIPSGTPRSQTERKRRPKEKKSSSVDLKYYQTSDLPSSTSDVMKTLFASSKTPESSDDEIHEPIQEEQSEDEIDFTGSLGGVDSLLASLSSLTKSVKRA
mmetsp:Transcript_31516/g.54624  ORF Transcript_31516/g.54624 Transcript_31516/m.54624 type:complete len:446 (+) Transcript_31516:660-1997(+)